MSHAKERVAAYLGTFDPLTLGHFDIIKRASKLFEQLIVGIGQNPAKNSCFSFDERLSMTKGVCQDLPNVKVHTFSGLAVDFAKFHKADVLIRGLRTEADFAYEMQMNAMNQVLNNKIESVFIPTRQELSHISSTLVKEVANLEGNVSMLVPSLVFKKLSEKFMKPR